MIQNDVLDEILDHVRNRYYGKYRGTVEDNEDPTGRGRLQVKVPAVLGDQLAWAMPCVPYAGDNIGNYMMPEAGSGVWVEFERGDPSYPVWVGGFWADGELPTNEAGQTAAPPMKIIRSEQGLMVTMDDEGQEITLSDENGNNMLKIAVTQGQVTIQGTAKVVVEAPLIELVENATHPVVFGDLLLQYLNQLVQLYQTHVHPGEMALGVFPVTPAPPVPPFPPATPQLLSQRVKAG